MIRRGEVYWVELSEGTGSEQRGYRPCVVLQNDIGNKYSPTTIVGVLTKQGNNKREIPTHTIIEAEHFKNKERALEKKFVNSTFLAEQIMTIDLARLRSKIGDLSEEKIRDLNGCIQISLGLTDMRSRA